MELPLQLTGKVMFREDVKLSCIPRYVQPVTDYQSGALSVGSPVNYPAGTDHTHIGSRLKHDASADDSAARFCQNFLSLSEYRCYRLKETIGITVTR